MRPLLLALVLPLVACHAADANPGLPATGQGPSRTYPASGFTGVAVTGSDDVEVHAGAGFAVRAEGDPAVLDALRITVEGSMLRVGRKPGIHLSSGSAKVFVTMPRIVAGAVSGSASMTIDRAEGAGFTGSTTGSGSLAIRTLAADQASLDVSGSGDITASGRARSLSVSASGSGGVDASGVVAQAAQVHVSGTGSVRAAVDGNATVSVSGTGDVDLGPKAHCVSHVSGTGSVRCG